MSLNLLTFLVGEESPIPQFFSDARPITKKPSSLHFTALLNLKKEIVNQTEFQKQLLNWATDKLESIIQYNPDFKNHILELVSETALEEPKVEPKKSCEIQTSRFGK